jgi:hypothetical protein
MAKATYPETAVIYGGKLLLIFASGAMLMGVTYIRNNKFMWKPKHCIEMCM